MINKDSKILVAVSGGVDSVYMLHMLVEQGYTNLGVVCFDHMLRDESANECEFVTLFANEYGIEAQSKSSDISYHAEIRNESIELVAREMRREYFQEVMGDYDYEWLALGQHADDQAETVLYNLLRGSGVRGLGGMLAEDKEQSIFRPLLHMTKIDIYKCARVANLEWHEDHTNQESDYDRNWLRNVIIPQLQKRRSGVKKVLADTAYRMQDMSDYATSESRNWFTDYFLDMRNGFSYEHFMAQHKVIRAEVLGLIWEMYNGSRKNFSNKVVFEVEKWLSSNPEGGTSVYFGHSRLVLKQNIVQLVDIQL